MSRPAAAAEPAHLSQAKGRGGMVVSVSPQATGAGIQILKLGGNAVDAAVAVQFALAVVWPEAGNIGGGGFMMVHPGHGEKPLCIDYRETAPLRATPTMFHPGDGRWTYKIVGVPGTVRGMETAHRRFGKLDWRVLLQPAIGLATAGFEVDAALAASLNQVLALRTLREGVHHREMIRVYGKPDRGAAAEISSKKTSSGLWHAGDQMVLPDLAVTLQRIADHGANGFYQGPVAAMLVNEMKRGGGWITQEDLSRYRAKIREPVHGRYRGYDIYGPPPPSSGGICLVEMLNVLEHFDLRSHARFSPRNLHLMAETMKRAFKDRAVYLGDTDFVAAAPFLTGKVYADKLAAEISLSKATPSEALHHSIKLAPESPRTTHFSVVDSRGMAVSNTTTLERGWGARIVVHGAGFLLNNEMGDFNWFPGHTDREGMIGTPPNQIEPGKRMLSSQTPVIVAKNGKPILVTGSPGGRTIINTVLQVVLNVIEFDMELAKAVSAPRIHHQWLPDTLRYEHFDRQITEATAARLREKGHTLTPLPRDQFQGDAHSIWIDPSTGERHGVADWRRNGKAAGTEPEETRTGPQ